MLRKFVLAVFLLTACASVSNAQQNPNVGPNDSFAWDQQATDLAAARSFVYKYYLDGALTGSVWANVTCTGTASPYTCQAKTPLFSNGQHTITISAANATGESNQSVPFGFVYGNPPAVPNNIRVVKGP